MTTKSVEIHKVKLVDRQEEDNLDTYSQMISQVVVPKEKCDAHHMVHEKLWIQKEDSNTLNVHDIFCFNNFYTCMKILCVVNHDEEFDMTLEALKHQNYAMEQLEIIYVFLANVLIMVQINWKV